MEFYSFCISLHVFNCSTPFVKKAILPLMRITLCLSKEKKTWSIIMICRGSSVFSLLFH